MGNGQCNCFSSTSPNEVRRSSSHHDFTSPSSLGNKNNSPATDGNDLNTSKLQHISEREQFDELDAVCTPSDHPQAHPIFLKKSNSQFQNQRISVYNATSSDAVTPKRRSSCSTIYLDDSTVSQPNIKASVKCVALAVFYHIKHRELEDKQLPDIFDEKLHPLSACPMSPTLLRQQKEEMPSDYAKLEPEHRDIYRFIRTLFNAAQLTAECAIVTLIYLERLLTYADICICPANWKRILLGAIMLASKVWDDQAVWNVDYCQILKDLSVKDMNEMERQFLELLNFNINVPSSVYAKYYFDLRELANNNNLVFPCEPLSKERARKLEATSRSCEIQYRNHAPLRRTASQDHMAGSHHSSVVLS